MDASESPRVFKRRELNHTASSALKLKERIRQLSQEGREEVTLYVICGLPPDESCIVGCVGWSGTATKKWYLRWERSGSRLDTPVIAYKSPQDAFEAAAELWAIGF